MTAQFDEATATWCVIGTIVRAGFATNAAAWAWADERIARWIRWTRPRLIASA
jgi:hypothetical protein